jgi:hypothetical protein
MPQVKICRYCRQEIDRETDKFVVVAKGKSITVGHRSPGVPAQGSFLTSGANWFDPDAQGPLIPKSAVRGSAGTVRIAE